MEKKLTVHVPSLQTSLVQLSQELYDWKRRQAAGEAFCEEDIKGLEEILDTIEEKLRSAMLYTSVATAYVRVVLSKNVQNSDNKEEEEN
jgi:hypothetical protein